MTEYPVSTITVEQKLFTHIMIGLFLPFLSDIAKKKEKTSTSLRATSPNTERDNYLHTRGSQVIIVTVLVQVMRNGEQ